MSGIPRDAVVFPLGGHVSAAVLDHLRHRRIPLAGTGYPAIDGVLQLTMERAALRTLATYLYDLGHRDVALLEMPQGASRGEGDTTPTANPEGVGNVMYVSIRTRTSIRRGAGVRVFVVDVEMRDGHELLNPSLSGELFKTITS